MTAHNLIPEYTQYYNGNLAIEMYTDDGELYADLTVNFGNQLPDNMAYLNDNDFSLAEAWVLENGIGQPTGQYMQTPFHRYPLYRFSIPA